MRNVFQLAFFVFQLSCVVSRSRLWEGYCDLFELSYSVFIALILCFLSLARVWYCVSNGQVILHIIFSPMSAFSSDDKYRLFQCGK